MVFSPGDNSTQILINVHQFTQEWEKREAITSTANEYTKPFDQFKLRRVPCTVLECTFMNKCQNLTNPTVCYGHVSGLVSTIEESCYIQLLPITRLFIRTVWQN